MDNGDGLRVLIAEDDFMVREPIRQNIEALNCIVVGEAKDGEQAFEMTQDLKPDLILMDIEMPKVGGLEATRRITENFPTPIIMLTAYDRPELVEEAGQAGAGAYLVKMPSIRELERAITIATARFDDMSQLRKLNEELVATLQKVKLLSGLLPICAHCKKIRDDEGYWQDVAVYIRDHSEAELSHGICPACAKKEFPDMMDEMQ